MSAKCPECGCVHTLDPMAVTNEIDCGYREPRIVRDSVSRIATIAGRVSMIEHWNDYQERTRATAFYPGRGTKLGLLYATLGFVGKSGELAEHGKKCLRDDGGILTPARRDKVVQELGDVLWYCAAIARETTLTLESARITGVKYYPENRRNYPGHGTSVGFGYVCVRMAIEIGKLSAFSLHVMPYEILDGEHWTDVGQGREIRSCICTAIGRVMWYAELIAHETGFTLEHVMTENIAKLASRKERGALGGDGSDR